MLEVAVIGAGAAGLVASRHLLGHGLKPYIFDAAKSIGGAWSTAAPTPKMWNGLHTNLSKHTCRFSEWPWPPDTPTFPSAQDMNDYLNSYATEFLVKPTCFQLQCQVLNIQPTAASPSIDDSSSYRVEWMDLTSQTKHSKDFQGVVVATGFFSKPFVPKGLLEDYKHNPNVIHSSEYNNNPESPRSSYANESVAVIGNSFSALEIAVDLQQNQQAKRVVSVLPSIPWVVPRYIFPPAPSSAAKNTTATSSSSFTTSSSSTPLPIDLAFYRRRQAAPQIPEKTLWTADDFRQRHEYLAWLSKHKQSQTPLGVPTDYTQSPMVAISDDYVDLLQQEKIEIKHGRLTEVVADESSDNEELTLRIQKSNEEGDESLSDITKVICCTGYQPNLEEFMDESILKTLDYDTQSSSKNKLFAPMTTCWDTLHPKLPNFAFCGMYKGPYMGIMELQGRLAAGVMSGDIELSATEMEEALEVSKQIQATATKPQFPHLDYVGFMDTLAMTIDQGKRSQKSDGEATSSTVFPTVNTELGDAVCPAFYQDNVELAQQAQAELKDEATTMKYLPRVVMSSMIGGWKYHRTICHYNSEMSGGRSVEYVTGGIQYSSQQHHSSPSDDDEHVPGELSSSSPFVLYREDGLYEYMPGKVMEVFREYDYLVIGNTLEIYFVEGGKRAHLFLSLQFTHQDDRGYWVATSDHLCIKDLYKGTFQVKLDGLTATEIVITYRVKGPAKDYESTTVLTPKSE